MMYQDVLINLFEAFVISAVITRYFNNENKKYLFLLFTMLALEINISNIYNRFDNVLPYFIIVTNILITKLFCKKSIYEIISICLLEDITHSSNMILTLFILTPFNINFFTLALIVQFIHLIICGSLFKYIKEKVTLLNDLYWKYIALITFVFSITVSIIIQMYLGMDITIIYYIIILISLYITIVSIYLVIYQINKINKEKIENEYIIHNLKLQKQNESYIMSINEKLRMIRHDLKHDYQLIQYYIDKQQYKKIEDIVQIRAESIEQLNSISCENKLIESIVNSKIVIAQSLNKKINCKISCQATNFIKDYHLNEILCNLIDNAIEHSEEGEIELIIQEDDIVLIIMTKNRIKSNKTEIDSDEHGYGLKNIQIVAQLYNGNLMTKQANEIFECAVSIPKSLDYDK